MGYKNKECATSKTLDDENHRINSCIRFKDKNLYESSLKFDFDCIKSDCPETVDRVIDVVCKLWELRDGANQMKP